MPGNHPVMQLFITIANELQCPHLIRVQDLRWFPDPLRQVHGVGRPHYSGAQNVIQTAFKTISQCLGLPNESGLLIFSTLAPNM